MVGPCQQSRGAVAPPRSVKRGANGSTDGAGRPPWSVDARRRPSPIRKPRTAQGNKRLAAVSMYVRAQRQGMWWSSSIAYYLRRDGGGGRTQRAPRAPSVPVPATSVQEYLVWFEDWNNQAKNTREDDNIRQINVRVRHTRSGSRVLRSTAAISVSRSGGQCKQIYTTENENYTTS